MNTIAFSYSGLGNRIKKSCTHSPSSYYALDPNGNTLATYTKEVGGSYELEELYTYGSSRLGVVKHRNNAPLGHSALEAVESFLEYGAVGNGSSLGAVCYTEPISRAKFLGYKTYELSNHLGNVLSVVQDYKQHRFNPQDTSEAWNYMPICNSFNDYYPFGMVMPGRTFTGSDNYRYGFNGQEKDDEISGSGNTLDFGERIYSPRIGRFLSADPLIVQQGKYPDLSPYQFASLTPISAIDLDGLEGLIVIRMDKPPTNFNKTIFASELQKRLIESGAHKDTRVVFENSKEYNDIGAWNRFWDYESDQSATITIRDMNIVRDAGHTDAGGYGEDGQIVIYRGLVGIKNQSAKDRELPTWLYVNVALHEIGHAVYDFFGNKETDTQNGLGHDDKGDSKTGTDIMDYDVAYKKDADYSDEQKKVIKETAGEDEEE